MPPQDNPAVEPDLSKLTPEGQRAYLTENDPAYAKLSPSAQEAYRRDINPPDPNRGASGSLAPPLTSAAEATKYGLREFGGGLADIGKGMIAPFTGAQNSTESAMEPFPGVLPAYRMGKGIADLGRQAMQVPGAIRDLAHSSDPLGTLALTAPRAGGQTAGALIASKAPAIASAVTRSIPGVATGLQRVGLTGIRMTPWLNKAGAAWRSTAPPVPPELTQAAALGRGTISGAPDAALGRIPMRDPYAGVDTLRSRLTEVPAESRAMGEIAPTELSQAEVLGRMGTTAAEKAALRNFMTSNPSALERIPPTGPAAATAPGAAGSMTEDVIRGSMPRGFGRLVVTPEEAAQRAQFYRMAQKSARERGMQFAGGQVPAEGRSVPMRPRPNLSEEWRGVKGEPVEENPPMKKPERPKMRPPDIEF